MTFIWFINIHKLQHIWPSYHHHLPRIRPGIHQFSRPGPVLLQRGYGWVTSIGHRSAGLLGLGTVDQWIRWGSRWDYCGRLLLLFIIIIVPVLVYSDQLLSVTIITHIVILLTRYYCSSLSLLYDYQILLLLSSPLLRSVYIYI